jgi:hypothetical protein
MKILILIQCTNLGGMEQATLPLIQEFVRMGIEAIASATIHASDVLSALGALNSIT